MVEKIICLQSIKTHYNINLLDEGRRNVYKIQFKTNKYTNVR